jgi:hypothetical protein
MENEPLKILKNVDRTEEEWDTSEVVGSTLGVGAIGGKELYSFLGRRGVCSTSLTKVRLEIASIRAMRCMEHKHKISCWR